jgi:amino acid permease
LISSTKASTSAISLSSLVVAIKNAQIDKLGHIVNGCILVFIISDVNSDLCNGFETLYGLVYNGKSPRIFAQNLQAWHPILRADTLFRILRISLYISFFKQPKAVFPLCEHDVHIWSLDLDLRLDQVTWASIVLRNPRALTERF